MTFALPWLVPSPVKKSSFTSLKMQGGLFNIEVDLGLIRPFDASDRTLQNVIHSDLQLVSRPDGTLRMGSGRSGFYRGHYLKGVGRTLIAGNWNVPEDRYHGTGILNGGGAAREYLASLYMKSKNLEGSIIPCNHVLFRKMEKKTAKAFEQIFIPMTRLKPPLMPLDQSLQAITVKTGEFSRLSNLNWFLYRTLNPSDENEITQFVIFMLYALTNRMPSGKETPEQIVKTIENTALTALEHFQNFHLAGVHWGSFEDNFTTEGRFLDLETPIFYGGPILGFSLFPDTLKTGNIEFRNVFGMEFMEYANQLSRFLVNFMSRLKILISGKQMSPTERQFTKELHFELDRMLKRQPLLSSKQDRITVILERMSNTHGLNVKSLFRKKKILIHPDQGLEFTNPTEIKKWNLSVARAEIHERATIGFISGIDPDTKTQSTAKKWNSILIDIDGKRKIDEIFELLENTEESASTS
jgi:hypothetical protein